MKYFSLFVVAFFAVTGLNCVAPSENDPNGNENPDDQPVAVFIGTYTENEGWVNGKADGIYRASVGEANSLLSLDTTVAEVINPSFVTVSPDKKNLYAVSELGGNRGQYGYVYAYNINEDLTLTFIDRYSTNANSPAYVSVDATGKLVFAANYQGGVVMVYKRNEDGSLEATQQLDHVGSGPHPNQNASHVHMAKVSPDNKYLFLPDLGSDKIWSYEINHQTGTLSKTHQQFAQLPAGSGPRHMDFHPVLPIAYVINELKSTISVFQYDASDGTLVPIQNLSTLPPNVSQSNSTADIHVHPNGKFLYGSNRGHNSIVRYSINAASGEISYIGTTSSQGEIPRNFAIHPNGGLMYVANQNSDNIAVFELNSSTGAMMLKDNLTGVMTPVCIAFY